MKRVRPSIKTFKVEGWGVQMEPGTGGRSFKPYLIPQLFGSEIGALCWCARRMPDGMMARAVTVVATITKVAKPLTRKRKAPK